MPSTYPIKTELNNTANVHVLAKKTPTYVFSRI